jgi:hypothetical protein
MSKIQCGLLISLEAPKKKPYDVDYKVRSLQEIIDMQTTAVTNIQTLLEVSVRVLHASEANP